MIYALPMLAVPWAMYSVMVVPRILDGNHAGAALAVATPLFSIPMPAASLPVSGGDLVLFVGLIMLFIELLKSTTSQKVAIVNHALSLLLLLICVVQFVLIPAYTTFTFFLLTAMVLLDVTAGFIVTIITARKDFEFTTGPG